MRYKRILSWILTFVIVFSFVGVPELNNADRVYAGLIDTVTGDYVYTFSPKEIASAVDVRTYLATHGDPVVYNDSQSFYYDQLNDVEKVIYLLMKDCDLDDAKFYIKGYNGLSEDNIFDMAENSICALNFDDPTSRLKWQMWRVHVVEEYFSNDMAEITLIRDAVATDYNIAKTNAIIDNIISAVPKGTDRYTTLMNMSIYMAGTRAYNLYSEGAGTEGMSTDHIDMIDQSPVGSLLYGYAVCTSFSYACKILCDRLDIPCICVANQWHAWNYVQMEDGKWYSIDWTYSDRWFDDLNAFELYGKSQILMLSLMGSQDRYYTSDPRYDLEFTLGGGNRDVVIPELSKDSYVYNGTYDYEFGEVADYEEPESRFTYDVNDDKISCTVTGYEGLQAGDLVIPEKIDELTVTAIGDSAFYRTIGFDGNVVIPDTVTVIGDCAFLGCNNITSLVLPAGLESVGRVPFEGCDSIASVRYACDNDFCKGLLATFGDAECVPCHTWDEGVVIKEAEVGVEGSKLFTCEKCGETREERLDALQAQGLAKGDDGNWYYYIDGAVDTTKTGIVENAAGFWYVENGQINFNKSGVVESDGKEYVVKYGYMSTGFYGLVKKPDGSWAYAEAGELTYKYTGLAKNEDNNTWWYITDGIIDFKYTGIGSNHTGDYRVVNGQIDFMYNGWFNSNGKWFYMKGGMVDKNKTGLEFNNDKYWYLENGEINFLYKGLVEKAGNHYYVKGGYVNFDYDGIFESDGVTYVIENGMVLVP